MKTEEHIIHTIWDTLRAGMKNQDDSINERLMRAFLSAHRGRHLNQYYVNARQLSDEVFQNIDDIAFTNQNNEWKSSIVPGVIRFKENFGFMAEKNDYQVSVIGSESWKNNQKTRYGKFHPSIKYIGGQMTLYLGQEQTNCSLEDHSNSELNVAVRKIQQESIAGTIYIPMQCVLIDTDDDPNYDFTKDPYPYPNEDLDNLINSVNARDFNIFLKTKSDEIGDGRDNPGQHQNAQELG